MANTVEHLDFQRCKKCFMDKPLRMFRKSSTCIKGVRGKCRACDGNRELARNSQKLRKACPRKQGRKGKAQSMITIGNAIYLGNIC